MSFEESLVWHASPTLASIKIANLYSFHFGSERECFETIRRFNSFMNAKGIYIESLRNDGDSYLIYVYRKSHLQTALGDTRIQNFLGDYGYSGMQDVRETIETLRTKLEAKKDFPHEIGIFLGYPLEDVEAFIDTKGKKCILCGDWKVYHDEETARCLFCKYKHCREIYVKVYKAGRRFRDMLVSA